MICSLGRWLDRRSWASACMSNLSLIIYAVEHRVAHPCIDGGLSPAGAAGGDANLLRERASLDFPVERRAAEASAIEHGVETKNAVGRIGRHGIVRYRASS